MANKKEEAAKKEDAAKKTEVSKQDAESGSDVVNFLKGTKEELDKVVWPSRQQLISESVAVLLMVGLSAGIIYLVDKLFRWASSQVF